HSVFLFLSSRTPRSLHSFPTRRSSDLVAERIVPDLQHAISLTPLYWLAGPVERIMAILCHASSRALILLGVSKRRYELALWGFRSEEHTSELQSLTNLVCRLLLEQKNT